MAIILPWLLSLPGTVDKPRPNPMSPTDSLAARALPMKGSIAIQTKRDNSKGNIIGLFNTNTLYSPNSSIFELTPRKSVSPA